MHPAMTKGSQASRPERVDRQELSQLKNQIATDQYEVDPKRVAEAIVTKLRLVRRGHLALAARRAGRSRPGNGPGPSDR